MADVPQVTIVDGLPTGGTGTVQTISTITDRLGEVQANPTANTLLDRLKSIAASVAGTITVAAHAVSQSGTWTVEPGNTANTTAWKVDGSSVTQPVSTPALVRKGSQFITNLTAATALTVPGGTTMAVIQIESQSVRWRDDGTNPTASVGNLIVATSSQPGELIYDGDSLAALRLIQVAASAKANIWYGA